MCSTYLCVLLGLASAPSTEQHLSFKNGDRVAFVGSALVEHERDHGLIETRLTQRFPDAAVTYRNFGWSGDTVAGTARTSGFQNPAGFARLLKEVLAYKPTVIFVGYGMNESFAGAAGLPGFVKGFTALLDQLSPGKAHIIVLSPTAHEDLGRPYPDPTAHNRNLEMYAAALGKIAGARQLEFVDLFHPFLDFAKMRPRQRLTTNGVLPNKLGYAVVARTIEEQLFGRRREWGVELSQVGKVLKAQGAVVANVKSTPALCFEVRPLVLPGPAWPLPAEGPRLQIHELPSDLYAVRIEGRGLRQATADELNRGVFLLPDPSLPQAEKLRAAIVKKSQLCYRRWRPFNDHERHWGFIGGDFKLYDDEIAAQERVIAELRRPAALHVEIVRKER